eukprot:CAMPEP_0172520626 /NCGR_PEP_ID=MMETSP1066-20121228/292116_1 /TAXON_ID=671091 /ORGANISM="Coscinodiscus wailesii, Strain CCMP2513" /LENGTH=214 /DNA_ID=CAMNT_0013303419 /DNA_START=102 /DNA_END=743 /DNA_ORIENTATION=-
MDSTDAPQLIEHLRTSLDFTPHDTKWIPHSARFVCLGISPKGSGTLRIYELSRGNVATTLNLPAALPHGIKCGTFGASRIEDRRIALGDYGGNLSICDLESSSSTSPSLLPLFSVKKAHDGIINAIDGIGGVSIGCGAPEIATGGRDGVVNIWDPRVDRAVLSFRAEGGGSSTPRDCWSVCFGGAYNDLERCVCAGYDNGDIKLFDMRTNTVRW